MSKLEQLVKTLRERIEAGEWKGNDGLPSRANLAKEYGISVATVSTATTRLQKEGMLHIIPGRGTFVAEGHAAGEWGKTYPLIGLKGSYIGKGETRTTYGSQIINAIWQAAFQRHSPLTLMPGLPNDRPLSIPYCKSLDIDGVIFLGGESYQEAMNLRESGFPVIIANAPSHSSPINYVDYDHAETLKQSVAKFADAGHRRIAVMFPSTTTPNSYNKYKAQFLLALHEAGLRYDIDPYWCYIRRNATIPDDFEGATEAIETLLDLPEPPTAILVWAHALLPYIEAVAQRRKLRIPQDLSIISSGIANERNPPVSCFVVCHDLLACELLDGLHKAIQNPFCPTQKLIPLVFRDRGTIAPPPRHS